MAWNVRLDFVNSFSSEKQFPVKCPPLLWLLINTWSTSNTPCKTVWDTLGYSVQLLGTCHIVLHGVLPLSTGNLLNTWPTNWLYLYRTVKILSRECFMDSREWERRTWTTQIWRKRQWFKPRKASTAVQSCSTETQLLCYVALQTRTWNYKERASCGKFVQTVNQYVIRKYWDRAFVVK